MKLAFTPYNENRVDCYWNNVFGIMMTRNPSFRILVPLVSSRYEMPIADQSRMSEEQFQHWQNNGLLLPHVRKWFPDKIFQQYMKAIDIPVSVNTDIMDTIKQYIREGIYCFVRLNRFHLSICPEFGKEELVHPIMIYGFDEDRKVVHLIEDCSSRFESYEVSYHEIEASYESIAAEEKLALGIQVLSDRLSEHVPVETILQNIEVQLNSESVVQDNITYIKGFEAVKQYRHRFHEAAARVTVADTNVHNRLSTPVFYQQRNLMLVEYLMNVGILLERDGKELLNHFTKLHQTWGLIRSKLLIYIMMETKPEAAQYFVRMDEYIAECLQEELLLEQMVNHLRYA
ncbi:hypothetical protein [Paenibacillus xylaniclasticus]|uniref:hypothetical protein n=1 Tax=Paenibacillus xylaniclasticus TaxID=588083 RepID=UPI000FDAEED7|nr:MULTISPECIES: hypothetical protein [Paenibacillus]GFN30753.1 hypothetical protein PCURB6_10130 [Paenibacillus curdlanolyticus]